MADSPEPERELDGDAASKAVSAAFERARANLRGGNTDEFTRERIEAALKAPEPQITVDDGLWLLAKLQGMATADLGPGYYFIRIPGKAPCPTCGAPEGVQLRVSTGGFGVGSGFEHKPECPALRCKHGVLWQDECATCEAERLDEGDW